MIRIIALLIAGPAFAGTPLLPPAEFDHDYAGRVEMTQLVQPLVRVWCGGRPDVNGCAQVVDGVCIIVMVNRPTNRVSDLRDLYRHEQAHCNGWRHD